MTEQERVVVSLTIAQARALLCDRDDCGDHSPADKSAAWTAVAEATQRVTAPESSGERCGGDANHLTPSAPAASTDATLTAEAGERKSRDSAAPKSSGEHNECPRCGSDRRDVRLCGCSDLPCGQGGCCKHDWHNAESSGPSTSKQP